MSESERLADQIRRAFEGEAWHGDSVREILRDVSSTRAAARPIPDAHTIWELVLHITTWDRVTTARIAGSAAEPTDDENFPEIKDSSEAAWAHTLQQLWSTHHALVKAVASFPDARLMELVPGKTGDHYNFFYLFSGIVQHELYHAGQIALLKKIR